MLAEIDLEKVMLTRQSHLYKAEQIWLVSPRYVHSQERACLWVSRFRMMLRRAMSCYKDDQSKPGFGKTRPYLIRGRKYQRILWQDCAG